jgi:hypothetical protein
MHRRDLLAAASAVGAVTIAGCASTPGGADGDDNDGGNDGSDGDGSGDDGSGGDGSSGGGGGGDGSGDGSDGDSGGDDDAALAIAQAVSDLNAVAIRLDKAREKLDTPEEIDVDVDVLLGAIEDARASLDAASETATDEQAAQIETLRHLATVLENQTRLVDLVREVRPEEVTSETKSAVDEREYDVALENVRDAKTLATEADGYAANAVEALDGVDPDRLAAVDGVEYERVESGVVDTTRVVDAFLALTTGYEFVILGAQDLETGREHSDREEYEAAEAAFADANAHFDDATTAFAADGGNPPARLATNLETAGCQNDHLIAASEAFADAAAHASDGDLATARERRSEGEDQYEQVSACGSDGE